MSATTIQAIILELETVTQFDIERELDERFTSVYPPFDPTIHAPIDWDQISLGSEDIEYGLLLRNWEFEKGAGGQDGLRWVEDWSRDVTRQTAGTDKTRVERDTMEARSDHEDPTRKGHPDYRSNDKNEKDEQSPPIAGVRSKRNSHSESGIGEKPGKRRRSSRVAVRQGNGEN